MPAIVPQGGAVTFRERDGSLEFLLVRAKRHPQHWIFPKGHIEVSEAAADSAIRELREEAGVAGELVGWLGSIEFQAGERTIRVEYFLCRFVEQIDEGEGRERCWCSPERALELLVFEQSRELIRRAVEQLRGSQL